MSIAFLLIMVIFMTLLDRIKHLAQQNGTNIKGLESAANLGNGTIRRWNNSPPSADKLLKIANLLNRLPPFDVYKFYNFHKLDIFMVNMELG